MSKIVELATKFFDIRAKSKEQTEALKETDATWISIETELLEAMVEEGVTSIKVDDNLFYMHKTNFMSVNAENKDRFLQYLKESGHGAIIKEDVNPRTLTAFLKGHLQEVSNKQEGDAIEAEKRALEFLKSKGAEYFKKIDIRVK